MASNPVVWFEIYVDDLARAQAFYEAVLGVNLEPLAAPGGMDGFTMLAFPSDMEKTGASGTLCKMDGMSPGVGGTLVYFSCADCAVEAARATRMVSASMAAGSAPSNSRTRPAATPPAAQRPPSSRSG